MFGGLSECRVLVSVFLWQSFLGPGSGARHVCACCSPRELQGLCFSESFSQICVGLQLQHFGLRALKYQNNSLSPVS